MGHLIYLSKVGNGGAVKLVGILLTADLNCLMGKNDVSLGMCMQSHKLQQLAHIGGVAHLVFEHDHELLLIKILALLPNFEQAVMVFSAIGIAKGSIAFSRILHVESINHFKAFNY